MPRLFVAVDLPEHHYGTLAALQDTSLPARWTPPAQYHLTLRFLGDVPEARVESVVQALALVDTAPFPLEGQGLDVFPSRRRPAVLFAEIHPTPQLYDLQNQIEGHLLRTGFDAADKPFYPHVTLARLKGARPADVRKYLRAHAGKRLASFDVTQFHLYESGLHPGGAVHTIRSSFELQRRSE